MLLVYTVEEREQWDTVVRSFADYDVYWLSGYVKAFQLHGDGEPMLLLYKGNATRGMNVVMRQDVAKDKHFTDKIQENRYFDFSSPYGYGGWLIEGEGKEQLFLEYKEWCQENNIISEFVRFHPVIENHFFTESFYKMISLGETITMDLSSPEEIWKNITSTNRNLIRKAQKNGIKIYNGRNPEIYELFREIYNQTMDRDHAEKYYYFEEYFYNSICEELSQHTQVFYATLNDKIIAAAIILMANGRMNYHLSGSIKEYNNLAPTNLLLYQAALWGCANGYKTFYLGGGVGCHQDSLFQFKKSFYRGKDRNHYFIGQKIFDQEKYNYLVQLRTDRLGENIYFPEYRFAQDKNE